MSLARRRTAKAADQPEVSIETQAGDWSWCANDHAMLLEAVRATLRRDERPWNPDGPLLTIALLDDAGVQTLNRQFRGKDTATNVLSFPSPPSTGAAADYLGDVAIAEQTVLREAAADGTIALHHLVHLCVHGTLHLLGFDHETDAEAGRMEAIEIDVLAGLGIADPYA